MRTGVTQFKMNQMKPVVDTSSSEDSNCVIWKLIGYWCSRVHTQLFLMHM